MRTVEAYMGSGNYKWVSLDKEVQVLHPENVNYPHLAGLARDQKLEEKLVKEKTRSEDVVGYVDGKTVAITLYADKKWTARIWSSRTTISGKYNLV